MALLAALVDLVMWVHNGGMPRRLLGWIGGIAAAAAVVILGVYFALVGLDEADKLASVMGAFIGLIGLALTVYGAAPVRRSSVPQPAANLPVSGSGRGPSTSTAASPAKDPATSPSAADQNPRDQPVSTQPSDPLRPQQRTDTSEQHGVEAPPEPAASPPSGSNAFSGEPAGTVVQAGVVYGGINAAPTQELHRQTTHSDTTEEHGVEFETSILRFLLVPIVFPLAVLIPGFSLPVIGIILLSGNSVPDWLWSCSPSVVWTCLWIWVGWENAKQIVVDHAGITVRQRRQSTLHFLWNEITSVEIRRIRGRSGLLLVAKPKLGSVLLTNKHTTKEWAKYGCLIIVDIKLLRGSPDGAFRAALAHYSCGKYQSETSGLRHWEGYSNPTN